MHCPGSASEFYIGMGKLSFPPNLNDIAALAQKGLSARITAGETAAGLWAGGVALITGLLNAVLDLADLASVRSVAPTYLGQRGGRSQGQQARRGGGGEVSRVQHGERVVGC